MKPLPYIPPDLKELPELDLYMDQLMEFLSKKTRLLQVEGEKPILTKAMVNNYVKFGILDKPHKKKYGVEHIMQLLMICHWKSVLTMEDIVLLMEQGKKEEDLTRLYQRYRALCLNQSEEVDALPKENHEWEGIVHHVVRSDWHQRQAKKALKGWSEPLPKKE